MNKTVKDLMVPISKYATVSEDLTVVEALRVLKEFQDNAQPGGVYPRAVLVKDTNDKIVGKLGYAGFLKSLDLKYHYLDDISARARSEVNKRIIHDTMNDLGFWDYNLPAIKKMASKLKMKDVIKEFATDQVPESCSLSEAMHKMIQLKVLSLLVTSKGEVTGIVRFTDLFGDIADYILLEQDS